LAKALTTIVLFSLAVGASIVWVAIQHNPQGEFCKEYFNNICILDRVYLFELGLNWTLAALIPLASIYFLLKTILKRKRAARISLKDDPG
jgi:hypothetical protein